MKYEIHLYENNQEHIYKSDNPHEIISWVTRELGQATHDEVEAEYLVCVKAKEDQIKELQTQSDRNLRWAIEAKTELQEREMKLGELFAQLLVLKQKEV